MPVSKNNRKTKKVKKQKGYRPVRALPGYKLVKDTCAQINDILLETAKLANLAGLLDPKFSAEDKKKTEEYLRKIIEVLAPGKEVGVDGVEVEYEAFGIRVNRLEKDADKIATRAHADDLEFVPILNQLENHLALLMTSVGESIAQLAIVLDTYAPREGGVSEVLEQKKEVTDVEPA